MGQIDLRIDQKWIKIFERGQKSVFLLKKVYKTKLVLQNSVCTYTLTYKYNFPYNTSHPPKQEVNIIKMSVCSTRLE